MIFGALALLTGSIWAKISWGHWWLWSENQLVLFLVLFLFYSRVLHAALLGRAGPQRANSQRGVRAVRRRPDPGQLPRDPAREDFIHPVVFTRHGPQLAGWMFVTFCVCWPAMLVLAYTLYRLELAGKRLDARLRELREVLRMTPPRSTSRPRTASSSRSCSSTS